MDTVEPLTKDSPLPPPNKNEGHKYYIIDLERTTSLYETKETKQLVPVWLAHHLQGEVLCFHTRNTTIIFGFLVH